MLQVDMYIIDTLLSIWDCHKTARDAQHEDWEPPLCGAVPISTTAGMDA